MTIWNTYRKFTRKLMGRFSGSAEISVEFEAQTLRKAYTHLFGRAS